MRRTVHFFTLTLIVGAMTAVNVSAESLSVTVSSNEGKKVSEAVVTATPVNGVELAKTNQQLAIDQIDKVFVDHVTVVQAGTSVSFPNRDNIRHHVYSFSKPKTFEIPLYLGTPREPTSFDTTGAVSLGCNIHDWMSAYVYVVDTPYYSMTGKSGIATLELPAGEYDVVTWHPRLRGPAKKTTKRINVASGKGETADITIKLKKVWKPRRSPVASRSGGGGYR